MATIAQLFERYRRAGGGRELGDELRREATSLVRRSGPEADWLEAAVGSTELDRQRFALLVFAAMRPFPRRFLLPVHEAIGDWSIARRAKISGLRAALRAWGEEGGIIEALVRAGRLHLPEHHLRIAVDQLPDGQWRVRVVAETEHEILAMRLDLGERDFYWALGRTIETAVTTQMKAVTCSECGAPLKPTDADDWVLCLGCGGAFARPAVARAIREATARD